MTRIDFVPTLAHPFPGMSRALAQSPYSHRSARFRKRHDEVLTRFAQLLPGFETRLFAGSGTLANEFLIWNFAVHARLPLVLQNGEFGRRLLKSCRAARQGTLSLDFGWGKPFNEKSLELFLKTHPLVDCILAVGCETSTGMENDLALLNRVAERHGTMLLLDGVSLLGCHRSLERYPAITAVSGSSGKALAGLPGLALISYRPGGVITDRVAGRPGFFSLAELAAADGVRNSVSSVLLEAFDSGLEGILELGVEAYRERLRDLKRRLVLTLRDHGYRCCSKSNSPWVTAFERPEPARWARLLAELERCGVGVYHEVEYLESSNLFEVAFAGDFRPADLDPLLEAFAKS